MLNYTYTITNKEGLSFKINDFTTDPNNFFALQQYPDMEIDVKNSEIDLQGQHGIWDFFSYFGKRNFMLSGVIIGQNEGMVEDLRTQMLRVLQLPLQPTDESDGYVTISWVDASGDTWSFDAKISRSPKFNRNMRQQYKLDFIISFKSDTPFILSSTSTTGTGTRGYFIYGILFPISMPATMGYEGVNSITINNSGNMSAHSVIRLNGEVGGTVNPTITNQTTNKVFKVNTTLADNTKYVEIDSMAGTVLDQDGNDLSANIDPDSEFILIKVGDNIMVYSADNEIPSPAGNFSVIFKNTKI